VIGRLSRPPHPVLYELLYEPQRTSARHDVLPYLLPIDAAHVVMLSEGGLIEPGVAAALLRVNGDMAGGLARGLDPLDATAGHRGVYFAYEQEYVTRLGAAVGGAAHLARSRNDINATIARLRLRDNLAGTLDRGCQLVEAVIALASAHVETTMSGFTHLQPAQPTTFGHYMTGVGFALLRTVEQLDHAYDAVNQSPMGAAAGYGTSFTIDRERVADLLGFAGVVDNSLDAVASRDYALLVLDGATVLGITLTRLCTDLQAWSSVAYEFLFWPDDLVSTSSIMPQKRNAFVLENIRGEATQAAGALVAALMAMKNVPFANSIEAGAEATARVWPALDATDRACALATLLLNHVEVSPDRARAFAAASDTGMTAVADLLVVEHGLSFRTAHDLVGGVLRDAEDVTAAGSLRARLEAGLASITGEPRAMSETAIIRALDPDSSMRAACYGGGPAPASVRRQLATLAARCDELRRRGRERHQAVAASEARCRSAVEAILRRAGVEAEETCRQH